MNLQETDKLKIESLLLGNLTWCVLCVVSVLLKSSEVIKMLKSEGWFLVHTKGSHYQFKHSEKPGRVTVPHPKKDLPKGTMKSIFRQAGIE
jgi:predicted RNA binding protein YcfA (HicA-like mRNA interferase family)